jgi:hypothetical protein
MMEAARTSETSVDIKLRTRQYIPEYSELHFLYLFMFFFQSFGIVTPNYNTELMGDSNSLYELFSGTWGLRVII